MREPVELDTGCGIRIRFGIRIRSGVRVRLHFQYRAPMVRLSRLAAATWLCLSPAAVCAQEVWRGDFEAGDTSQFDGELNGRVGDVDQITIVEAPVAEGRHAARIELVNDARWPNGLKRVELHHSTDAGRTAEGEELYFAWSIHLPETLPRDPDQQIAYWETDVSYSQLMAFTLIGTDLRFSTNHPMWHEHWTGRGVVTPGAWHRVAMHIVWSRDPALGTLDVWFDGEQVVTGAHAATLVDTNAAFIQMGLLRGAIEFDDAPVILIDDAVEGDSLASVRPERPSMPADAGALGEDAGSESADAGVRADGGGEVGLDAAGSAGLDAAARADAGPSVLAGSCGCHAAGRSTVHGGPAVTALVLAGLLGQRSRRRTRAALVGREISRVRRPR